MKYIAQILMFAAFVVVVGVLSAWPSYELVDEEHAIISVVFLHAGQRVSECKILSQDELNKLPPNMRKPADCPRERFPVRVEFRVDDRVLYAEMLPPSGIWSDGKASIYQRIEVPAGTHELFIGMNDSGGQADFDYSKSVTLNLTPARNLVIRFDDQTQQFLIR